MIINWISMGQLAPTESQLISLSTFPKNTPHHIFPRYSPHRFTSSLQDSKAIVTLSALETLVQLWAPGLAGFMPAQLVAETCGDHGIPHVVSPFFLRSFGHSIIQVRCILIFVYIYICIYIYIYSYIATYL